METQSGFKLLKHFSNSGASGGSVLLLGIVPVASPTWDRAELGDGTWRSEPAWARGREIIHQTRTGKHSCRMKGQQL